MPNETVAELLQQIQEKRDSIRKLRAEERSLDSQEKIFLTEPLIKRDSLRENLKNSLPKNLVPSNIGDLEQIVWNYEYPLSIDFKEGTNSIIKASKTYELTEQIGQESCFILTGITRSFNSQGIGGIGLPLKFLIRDRQSTRQIMDKPIALAHIAHSGKISQFATPYLFMPNARMTVELMSMLDTDMNISGSTLTEITLIGIRCRINDVSRIIEAMYL